MRCRQEIAACFSFKREIIRPWRLRNVYARRCSLPVSRVRYLLRAFWKLAQDRCELSAIPNRATNQIHSINWSSLVVSMGYQWRKAGIPVLPEIFSFFWSVGNFYYAKTLDHCIVFHDSLLPELRGFSPTVTALLLSLDVIGVTAFRPAPGLDTGPICGSRRIQISQGTSIRAALELQSSAMVDLAIEILERTSNGTMVEQIQDQDAATFSLWRDEYDYFIDWRLSASEILRLVQALGFPYEGAKGIIDNELVTVQQARLGPDPPFAIRNAGKLWQIEERKALVVCGSGTLWIEEAFDGNGQAFYFRHLRARFLTSDNAWIAAYLRGRASP